MKKKKKGSLILKIFAVAFCLYAFYKFAGIKTNIIAREKQIDDLSQRIEEQKQQNAELDHILNSETDEEYMEKIAREKLGYAFAGERIFVNGD